MASCSPVEAPDGTAARPKAPLASLTSTSTVGLPRESMISRAVMAVMVVFMRGKGRRRGTSEPEDGRNAQCEAGALPSGRRKTRDDAGFVLLIGLSVSARKGANRNPR